MSTVSFCAGAVLELEGHTYTLLRLLKDDVWQAEEYRTKRIQELTEQQLRSLYVEGQLRFQADPRDSLPASVNKQPVAAYTEEQWELAKVRRAYVMATLGIPNTTGVIEPAIREVWEKLGQPAHPPHRATVIRWKKKFIDAGRDITAIVEQTQNKGNRASRYPREVEDLVHKAIDAEYLTPERGTVEKTLEHALNLVLRENELRPSVLQLPLPTRRLVKRMIDAIPAFDRYAARHGRTAAVKKFRSVQAHRTTLAPLERAEIDHTPLDLMVIDDDTGLPLGRPYITACIDDFTRCMLGLYVSFEPPSHFTVARCLKQAFMPKTWLAKQYPEIQNEWQAHGVMRELVVDNGAEFHSKSLENACYTLGIEMHYSARKTPWFKGKVERFLGTLNRAVAHGTPGTTFANIFEKEDYDPSKHAVVRYSVLKEVVTTWIVDVYHQQVHRTLKMPPALMWSSSISPQEIQVPQDPARLDAILGKSETRRLTHKGIELDSLFYNSHELTGLRRRLGHSFDVEIRFDTSDMGKITVISPDKHELFEVKAINFEYANGISQWQHHVCKRFAARHLDEHSPDGWLKAKARIAELIDNELSHKRQKSRTRVARYKEATKGGLPPAKPFAIETEQLLLAPPNDNAYQVPPESVSDLASAASATNSELVSVAPRKFQPIYRERTPVLSETNQES